MASPGRRDGRSLRQPDPANAVRRGSAGKLCGSCRSQRAYRSKRVRGFRSSSRPVRAESTHEPVCRHIGEDTPRLSQAVCLRFAVRRGARWLEQPSSPAATYEGTQRKVAGNRAEMAMRMRWLVASVVVMLLGLAAELPAQSPRRPFRLKQLLAGARDSAKTSPAATAVGGLSSDAATRPAVAEASRRSSAGDGCTGHGGCTAPVVPSSPRFPPPPNADDASVPSAAEYFHDPFAAAAGHGRPANASGGAGSPLAGSVPAAGFRPSLRTPHPPAHGMPLDGQAAFRLRALAGALNGGYSGPSQADARGPWPASGLFSPLAGRVGAASGTAPSWGFVSHSLPVEAGRLPWQSGEMLVPAGALPPLPQVTPLRPSWYGPRVAPEPWPFRPDSIPY